MIPDCRAIQLQAVCRLEHRAGHADNLHEQISVGLLLLSQHVETHSAVRLMTEFEGGVKYVLKERVSDLAGFAADIRRVASGECVIDAELVGRLVAKKRERDPLGRLTDRERTVLDLLARGRSNRALARELHVSDKTVETHVRSIFTKLDLAPDEDDHRRVRAVLPFLRSSWRRRAGHTGSIGDRPSARRSRARPLRRPRRAERRHGHRVGGHSQA